MKTTILKFIALSLSTALFFQNVFGSPLVFKVTKQIKNETQNSYLEIATFDSSKYKQIRVGLKFTGELPKIGQILDTIPIKIEAVENEDFITLHTLFMYNTQSYVLEIPTNRIRISAKQSGTYKVFVWAN